MKKLFYLLLLVTYLTGCNKKSNNSDYTDTPVIESYLSPGNYLSVKVTRQIPFSNQIKYSEDDINHLSITVTYGNISKILTPKGNGEYIDSTVVTGANPSYNISFKFNSKNVEAYTYIPEKPSNMSLSVSQMTIAQMTSTSSPPTPGNMTQVEPIKVSWTNSDHSNYIVVVENIETTLEAIRDFGDKDPPGNIFKKSPTTTNEDELRSMDFQYYGTHRIILFHVLPDYASLYDQDSNSSLNLSNPSTSITNGYGIFTGMNSDTLYVEIIKE